MRRFRLFYIAKPWIAAALLAAIAAGCTTTRYVSVPERHEVVVHQRDTASMRDSIFVHDSICIVQRGDTVFVERHNTVCRDRWRDRLRVDSFIQRDTVAVVREAGKPPGGWKWQQLGSTLLCAVLGSAVYFIIRMYIDRYRRG